MTTTTPEDSYTCTRLRPRRSQSASKAASPSPTDKIHRKTPAPNRSTSETSPYIQQNEPHSMVNTTEWPASSKNTPHNHLTGSTTQRQNSIKANGLHTDRMAMSLIDTPKRTIMQRVLIKQIEQSQRKSATCTPNEHFSTPVGQQVVDASFRTEDKISPMLAKLRMTPGKLLKETQSILKRKHDESRRKIDKLNVGGGVSLWPEMENMRLTSNDVCQLAGVCLALCGLVVFLFYLLHGSTVRKLLEFQQQIIQFSHKFPIDVTQGQKQLDHSLIEWHINYRHVVDKIHEVFDVSKVPLSYIMYMLVYVATVAVLFFYLIDNMFAKSKLSPNRIRRWVCLLTMTGTWTVLMLLILAVALITEVAVETNIHILSGKLADLIPTNMSCVKFNTILQYWRTRCLPPMSRGTISIFGIVPVRDVTFYLQFYSIPIITVLLIPVFKVIVSVMTVYNIGTKFG